MINDNSLRAVAAAGWTDRFIMPLYESYCFSNIPQLVRHILMEDADTGLPADTLGHLAGPYDKVILFFIDAFGWRFFEQYHERYPFLRRIVREGVASELTSQFPSTTAAHVTAIHTGLPVGRSGVYEWFYYEPLVDRIIAPLLFSFAGDHERDTLRAAGVRPEHIYPRATLYQELARRGVASYFFQSQAYTPSSYSGVVSDGARVVPYRTLPEALATLADMTLAERGKAYYFLYFDDIDATCHRHGPGSDQLAAEIDAFLMTMESAFYQSLAGKAGRTLFLMTADHGQIEIDPATTVYLNVAAPGIIPYIKTNRAGRLLAPAGSPRDLFLHIKPECLDGAQAYLRGQLAGKADIYRVPDLIDAGFFGTADPSPAFRGRVGDLVVLPYRGESVWWYERDRFDQHYYGHHGGLTREEMETALLAQSLG